MFMSHASRNLVKEVKLPPVGTSFEIKIKGKFRQEIQSFRSYSFGPDTCFQKIR